MKLLLALLILLLLAAPCFAQDTTSVTWQWTKALTGTTPVAYLGEIMIADQGDTMTHLWSQARTDTTFTYVNYHYGTSIRMRVQGKDANDIVGPLSLWAEWFVDWGTPGELGTPVVIKVGEEPVE